MVYPELSLVLVVVWIGTLRVCVDEAEFEVQTVDCAELLYEVLGPFWFTPRCVALAAAVVVAEEACPYWLMVCAEGGGDFTLIGSEVAEVPAFMAARISLFVDFVFCWRHPGRYRAS
jgi:hypothetical protein